ncbi:MAG: peptidase E [Prochlorococcus sp. SP3034]|nr:peptidase E [Prochlorococcus sp. SP3034]
MVKRNIIAIGGGGFGRSLGNLEIERYIVSLAPMKRPRICFIPTASGDNDLYKLNYYRAFSQLNCNTSHLDFFARTEDLEKKILDQDIIYVGGGNTKTMLAVWRDWGLDTILKKAYKKGIVMSGVSAGAICWFNRGITDSYSKNLRIIDCLGFVEGIACPHFDEESEREPFVNSMIEKQIIESCICIEGNCAIHIANEKNIKAVNFGTDKKSYKLYKKDKKILKDFY